MSKGFPRGVMSNTYWNGNGTYQGIIDKLSEEIPMEGACEDKAIDRLRKAINAYYDIYNNGGCNSVSRKVSYFFPGRCYRNDWESVEKITEPKMDDIILKVAKKKGLI
jgi:hypothetical protein